MNSWAFFIPYLEPMNTSATRRHWSHAARQAAFWKDTIAKVNGAARRVPVSHFPLDRATVVVTRCSSTAKHPDIDNLQMAAKPLFDALVHCGILRDDGPEVERIITWRYAPRREQGTNIQVGLRP
mgnify:CR=1 FL=1